MDVDVDADVYVYGVWWMFKTIYRKIHNIKLNIERIFLCVFLFLSFFLFIFLLLDLFRSRSRSFGLPRKSVKLSLWHGICCASYGNKRRERDREEKKDRGRAKRNFLLLQFCLICCVMGFEYVVSSKNWRL